MKKISPNVIICHHTDLVTTSQINNCIGDGRVRPDDIPEDSFVELEEDAVYSYGTTSTGAETEQELIDELEAKEAFGRGAAPWEVSNVMVFLASDYSSYMTGEIVAVSSQQA